MPTILITKPKYSLTVQISPEDEEYLNTLNWFVTNGDKRQRIGYAVSSAGRNDENKCKLLWMHKIVLLRAVGPPPTPAHRIGDHLDGNTLNNRRDNLRWATPQMNARNIHGFAVKQLSLDLCHSSQA